MQIEKIVIRNFKGLQNSYFEPGRFSCLVGENNAGKSSVLQSLVYALNRPSQLPLNLFYDENEPVEFHIAVGDVTPAHLLRLAENHRVKFENIIVENKLHLLVRYPPNAKIEVKVKRLIPKEEKYQKDHIDEVFKGKKVPAVNQALNDIYPEFSEDAPPGMNITNAKDFLAEKIGQLPGDQFSLEEAPLPSGIDSSITALLPEPIYIPAVKNLNDDLKTTQSTSFGRLLGLLLDDMSPDLEEINKSLEQLNSFFNRVEQDGQQIDDRHQSVKNLEGDVERLLAANFPTAKVELEVPPPELKTIINNAKIYIDDGSRDIIDNKGDGIKRSLTFALLQCYVERLNRQKQDEHNDVDVASRPLLFLFEEPELFLHPKSQRILFETLFQISKKYQVVVTTHSPLFFAPGVTANFVRVAKEEREPKPIGKLHPVNFDLDQESAEIFRLARFENADAAFFSQSIILFEGESDDAYFKHISKLLNGDWDFDVHNIALVRVSGKGNFSRFRKFFESFGISIKIVADLDAIFEGFQHLGATDEHQALRDQAIQSINIRVAELGIKPELSRRQIKNKVSSTSWRDKYDAAKQALQTLKEAKEIDEATLDLIDGLFIWENDIARVRACHEDDTARQALTPLLDAMREHGICVLSRGAIEDYYPNNIPDTGPKPDRALAAVKNVTNRDAALALSTPMENGREPELVEICARLFLK